MLALAKRLRPDIDVNVRALHLKHAIEKIGPDITRLDGYYCLSSVSMPYGEQDFANKTRQELHFAKNVRCQIDLGVSAEGVVEPGDASIEDSARRALSDACHLRLSDKLWTDETQFRLRQNLGLDAPLKFWDGPKTKVFILFVPTDAAITSAEGKLCFSEASPSSKSSPAVHGGTASGPKTIEDWKREQGQFRELGPLPLGWIYCRSKSGEVYYWNTATNKPTFERPLPEGWTKQKSKTNGKVYYFNARKNKSIYEVPTEKD